MSDKDAIRNMVQNLIKSNETEAEMNIHPVFTNKLKELISVNNAESVTVDEQYPEIDSNDDEDNNDENE
jgi:hypothetical protein